MSQDNCGVTIHYRNGDTMSVGIVLRLVGADWLTARSWEEKSEENNELVSTETIVHTDDVRAIVSSNVAPVGESGINFRAHYGDDISHEEAKNEVVSAWEGQHQLHPNDDPSAYPESEQHWPPRDGSSSDDPENPSP